MLDDPRWPRRRSTRPASTHPLGPRVIAKVDNIWLRAASRMGFRVVRSRAVFASYDGAGTLKLGHPATLDKDDSLSQLVFHELCHGLMEGRGSERKPDWGFEPLCGDGDARERRCIALQAYWTAAFELESLMFPTTEYRPVFETYLRYFSRRGKSWPLPESLACQVRQALSLSAHAPWAPHLGYALHATRQALVMCGRSARRSEPSALTLSSG